MADIEQMIRTRQVQDAALAEVNHKVASCKSAIQNFEHLSTRLSTLPEKLSYDIMVKYGKVGFMQGKLVHTNELMVHLGDTYFASMTCKQAIKIIELRQSNLKSTLTDLEKVALNITKKTEYLGEMEQAAKENEAEIREECPESYVHPKDRRRVSRVQGDEAPKPNPPKAAPVNEHATLMARLDELERLEEEDDEIDRLSDSDDDVADSRVNTGKKVRFAIPSDDDDPPIIRFKHSAARPKPSDEITPGDVYDLVTKNTSKAKEERTPGSTEAPAVSNLVIERPLEPVIEEKIASSGSKPVSKFKAGRRKLK